VDGPSGTAASTSIARPSTFRSAGRPAAPSFSDRLHTKVIREYESPIGDDVVYSLNLPGEVDGRCVAAANDDGDALAGRRAVTLREQGCEGCCSSRLGDNAQHRP